MLLSAFEPADVIAAICVLFKLCSAEFANELTLVSKAVICCTVSESTWVDDRLATALTDKPLISAPKAAICEPDKLSICPAVTPPNCNAVSTPNCVLLNASNEAAAT